MASNLLELRRAAGYSTASDFAEEHGIPASTYARYESKPSSIPLKQAWMLADELGTSIDAVVGRQTPDPAATRGEVQREYDALCPEARALADEFREFVREKDKKLKAHRQKEEGRLYEALCYQYEHQMLAKMREQASFGEVIGFDSAATARETFLQYLRDEAARKRGKLSTKAQKLIDDRTIEKIMEAYDRTHGEFEEDGLHLIWSTVDHGVLAEFGTEGGKDD